jgi:hypothetical protein
MWRGSSSKCKGGAETIAGRACNDSPSYSRCQKCAITSWKCRAKQDAQAAGRDEDGQNRPGCWVLAGCQTVHDTLGPRRVMQHRGAEACGVEPGAPLQQPARRQQRAKRRRKSSVNRAVARPRRQRPNNASSIYQAAQTKEQKMHVRAN